MRPHPLIAALGPDLHRVENPSQYLGGEYAQSAKHDDFRFGIVFPDVYAIGMSNHSIKVLYDMAHHLPGIQPERAFAPDLDMEALLREHGLPLGTLESGTPLSRLDLVGISVGFELSATNILTILDLGGLGLRAAERGPDIPLVIGGGPGLTNPGPFGTFFDGIVIGEAEDMLPGFLARLKEVRSGGGSRQDQLDLLHTEPSVWHPGRTTPVRRAVWHGFTSDRPGLSFPVPSIKVAQDHGVVEIMRGCPQGCRFCHAGMFYRPYRQKTPSQVAQDVASVLKDQGYRSITLASLSSGDYHGVKDLFRALNNRYRQAAVSFSLPSLKVNSFNLDLVEELASGKKSGLTFAVESPALEAQRGINKMVALEDTLRIIQEAKSHGWRSVKLYFMVGLPVAGYQSTDEEIAAIREYILAVRHKGRVSVNVSVGTFVPKPHTPFQWAPQLHWEEAGRILSGLKHSIKDGAVRISYQDPFHSFLEGVIARGPAWTGELILEAWRRGARFDAWDEKLDRELWRGVFVDSGRDVDGLVCSPRTPGDAVPWDLVRLGIAPTYLEKERERALTGELTPHCTAPCDHHCGVCSPRGAIAGSGLDTDLGAPPIDFGVPDPLTLPTRVGEHVADSPAMLFSFSKDLAASFIPHLGLVNTLERAFMRMSLPYSLSNGFSPSAVLELAQALSVGVEAKEELALVHLHAPYPADDFVREMNRVLPSGLAIGNAALIHGFDGGRKAPSLSGLATEGLYELGWQGRDTAPPGLAAAGLGEGTSLFPLAGPGSLRHRAEDALGRHYLAAGLTAKRLGLVCEGGRGFRSFARKYRPWDQTG